MWPFWQLAVLFTPKRCFFSFQPDNNNIVYSTTASFRDAEAPPVATCKTCGPQCRMNANKAEVNDIFQSPRTHVAHSLH